MSETKYSFTRKGLTDAAWKVSEGDKEIAEIMVNDTIIAVPKSCDLSDDELNEWLTGIEQAFMDFTDRPEYVIGKMIPQEMLSDGPIDPIRQQELMDYMGQYVKGCCAAIYSDGLSEKYAQRALAWLETTDFYTAHASTKYYDNDALGLLRHTLKVVNNVTELSHMSQFKDVNLAEAILAAIVHDWCKINFYEEYDLYAANARYPMVLLLQIADQLSAL